MSTDSRLNKGVTSCAGKTDTYNGFIVEAYIGGAIVVLP
jgi:hypothetical protein